MRIPTQDRTSELLTKAFMLSGSLFFLACVAEGTDALDQRASALESVRTQVATLLGARFVGFVLCHDVHKNLLTCPQDSASLIPTLAGYDCIEASEVCNSGAVLRNWMDASAWDLERAALGPTGPLAMLQNAEAAGEKSADIPCSELGQRFLDIAENNNETTRISMFGAEVAAQMPSLPMLIDLSPGVSMRVLATIDILSDTCFDSQAKNARLVKVTNRNHRKCNHQETLSPSDSSLWCKPELITQAIRDLNHDWLARESTWGGGQPLFEFQQGRTSVFVRIDANAHQVTVRAVEKDVSRPGVGSCTEESMDLEVRSSFKKFRQMIIVALDKIFRDCVKPD